MSQRTIGDQKSQSRIDEVERARAIGERLGDERAKAMAILFVLAGFAYCAGQTAPGEEMRRRE